MSLTDEEKMRIRYFLGYPLTESVYSLQSGIPVPLQTYFLLESAMNHVMSGAIPRVRQILAVLENIELQLIEAQVNLAAEQVGEIRLRSADSGKTHTDLLEREYRRWALRLSECFGAPVYWNASRFGASTGSSINVRVSN